MKRRLLATAFLILVLTRENEWRAFEGYEDVTAEYFGVDVPPQVPQAPDPPGEDYGSSSEDDPNANE